jgi:lipoate-protein ligase A
VPAVRWRLIVHGPEDPAWNMAFDRTLLAGYAAGEDAPPTLRLYGWSPGALSLGRRQPEAGSHDPGALARQGLVLVRRPTGGLAVLHDGERTYAVAGALRREPFPGGVLDTYRRVARALVAGLARLGIDAEPVPPGRAAAPGRAPGTPSCFDDAGAHEIAWRGRKLVGSAQVRARGGFVQHGSIPVRLDPARLAAVLGRPVDATRFADLSTALGRTPSHAEIDAALVAGFEEAFGCEFERLTPEAAPLPPPRAPARPAPRG